MEAVERFEDPLAAAKHIVQEAFRTWLRYEVRTDDITIIVLFIEGFVEGTGGTVSVMGSISSTKSRRKRHCLLILSFTWCPRKNIRALTAMLTWRVCCAFSVSQTKINDGTDGCQTLSLHII